MPEQFQIKQHLTIFLISHWAVAPEPDLTGKQLQTATLMHALVVLGGKE